MPPGAGRKIDAAWQEVTKLDNATKVQCNHCCTEISSKIERIKAHLEKCLALQSNGRDKRSNCLEASHVDKKTQDSMPSTSGQSGCTSTNTSCSLAINTRVEDTCDSKIAAKKSKLGQLSMSNYTVKTSPALKKELDLQIAKFFYANNIAFNAARSSEYTKMTEALRPGYTGPSSDQLGGHLLDTVHEEIDREIARSLQLDNASLTLIMDGWSSVRNDPIIATSIHNGEKSYLLNTVDSGAEKKTAEYCAKIADESMTFCNEKLGQKVNHFYYKHSQIIYLLVFSVHSI